MVIVKSAQSHGSQENNFTLRFFLLSRQQQKKQKRQQNNGSYSITIVVDFEQVFLLSFICIINM